MHNHEISIPPMLNHQEAYILQQHIYKFFDLGRPDQLKKRLWEVFRSSMASEEADSFTNIERSDILFLYEKLSEFIDDIEPLRAPILELRREASCMN